MKGIITMITPPDFFENENPSVLFVNLSEKDQDAATQWLGNAENLPDLNFYVYSGEPNAPWFLYAVNRCEYKYINFDTINVITQALGGYSLGKKNTFYHTTNENLAAVYSHINQHRVTDVVKFLETSFGNQTTKS
jgi:hypothetical protein